MREKHFQTAVIKWLDSIGAYVVNVWGGGYQRSGVPDLIVCYRGRFIALELKTDTGRVTPVQNWNVEQIKKAGGVARVLRPGEYQDFRNEVEQWK